MYKKEEYKGNNSYFNNKEKVLKDTDGNKDNGNNAKKPLRYDQDDVNKSLLNKNLKITLINGREIIGVLSNLGMYDLTVKAKITQVFEGNISREVEKPIIILKSAIATVEVL